MPQVNNTLSDSSYRPKFPLLQEKSIDGRTFAVKRGPTGEGDDLTMSSPLAKRLKSLSPEKEGRSEKDSNTDCKKNKEKQIKAITQGRKLIHQMIQEKLLYIWADSTYRRITEEFAKKEESLGERKHFQAFQEVARYFIRDVDDYIKEFKDHCKSVYTITHTMNKNNLMYDSTGHLDARYLEESIKSLEFFLGERKESPKDTGHATIIPLIVASLPVEQPPKELKPKAKNVQAVLKVHKKRKDIQLHFYKILSQFIALIKRWNYNSKNYEDCKEPLLKTGIREESFNEIISQAQEHVKWVASMHRSDAQD